MQLIISLFLAFGLFALGACNDKSSTSYTSSPPAPLPANGK